MDSRLAFASASLLAAFITLLPTAPPVHASDIVVKGKVHHDAVYKAGNAAATSYEVTTERYIVEAVPANVGSVVALDHALVQALCRDKDGCYLVLQMVNWDSGGQPGNVASLSAHLFLSEDSNWWRLSDVHVDGLDSNDTPQEWTVYDCYFGDAETAGNSNQRFDAGPGFGLLNIAGGSFSDDTTTCRVLLSD